MLRVKCLLPTQPPDVPYQQAPDRGVQEGVWDAEACFGQRPGDQAGAFKDQLSKLILVGSQLPKEMQKIKRAWGPTQDTDKDEHRDKKGKGWWRKKGDGVNEVTVEESTPTNDAPQQSPCSQGPS